MQVSAALNRLIAEKQLNSIFTNDLKRFFFRKKFIATDSVFLNGEIYSKDALIKWTLIY